MRDVAVFPPIQAEYAAGIGNVAYHWSLVEGQLDYMIADLLGLHRIVGRAVTAELPMLAKMNLAHTLVGLTGEVALIGAWKLIETDLDAARVERNDHVHGEWVVVGAEHIRTRVKAKQKVTVTRVQVPLAELETLSERLWALVERIARFTISSATKGAAATINQESPPGPPPNPIRPPKPPSPNRIPRAKRKAARKTLIEKT